MTSRQRYSSFNCRARGQTEYSLERNTLRSSSKASHSNNVCWIVSDSRDSQQGHCALRTSCVRLLELRRSWQPNRNFVFNLRPSRRDAGHALSKYSGKPKRKKLSKNAHQAPPKRNAHSGEHSRLHPCLIPERSPMVRSSQVTASCRRRAFGSRQRASPGP